MPRIDIELTSALADGRWTWRAAGARQPKGTVESSLLPGGVKVGDVLRADLEVDVDGMTVTAVLPPRSKRTEPDRIEIIGPPREHKAPDYSKYTGTDDRRRAGGGRSRDGDRGRGRGGDRPSGREPRERPLPGGRPDRPAGRQGARPDRQAERARPPRERASGPAPPPAPKPRAKRLQAGRAHRDAVVASLPPEERPIAEQVLRGGIPAVRQALEEQNTAARAAGAPEVRADALVAMAEAMLPRLRAAEWLDRAEAAVSEVDEVALRDLRALVAGADAAGREEAGRELAGRLRRALDERRADERERWLTEITGALDDGRIVRALRASGRPPEPGVRFPTALADRLSAAAGEALAPDVAPDRWAAVLEAVGSSPVRRTVQPRGLPEGAPPELVAAARQQAGRVPGLAALVGAPPPAPVRARAGARPVRPGPGTSERPGPRPPARSAAVTRPTPPPAPAGGPPAEPAEPAAPAAPAAGSITPPPPASGDDADDAVLVEELG